MITEINNKLKETLIARDELDNFSLEDLKPSFESKRGRSGHREPGIYFSKASVYINKAFKDKYLISNEGYYIIFDHPKRENVVLLGFYKDASSVLPMHKSNIKRYKVDNDNAIILSTSEPAERFGKQQNVLFESLEVSGKVFFMLMPDVIKNLIKNRLA